MTSNSGTGSSDNFDIDLFLRNRYNEFHGISDNDHPMNERQSNEDAFNIEEFLNERYEQIYNGQVGNGSASAPTENQQEGFRIVRQTEQYFERFRMTGQNIEISFASDNDAFNWLESGLNQFVEYIKANKSDDDYIGLTFTDLEKPHMPLYISFRRVDQLSAQIVLNSLEKVAQSNSSFLTASKLQITVQHIASPRGYGRVKMIGRTFAEFCDRKSGILVVKNNNNLCFAYALCLAIARVTDEQKFLRLQTCDTVLENEALDLCRSVGSDLSNGAGLEEFKLFQNYLSEYIITIYDNRRGNNVLFSGRINSQVDEKKSLNLIYENNHFNVILSLTAAFSHTYFCEVCHKGYSSRMHHRSCPTLCPCCLSRPKCTYDSENQQRCKNCNRYFRGNTCYLKHLRSVCEKLQNCKICFTTVDLTKPYKHECGKSYCQVCMRVRDVRHNCYMPIDLIPEKKKSDNPLYIFYDLECTQEENLPGTTKFIHKPNLCIAHKICNHCKNEASSEHVCDNCGVRETVIEYSENNCVISLFLKFVISLPKKFNRIVLLAHNMGAYDGHFILKKIVEDVNSWSPKVVMNGNKIILITCSRYRFLDSLNFLPAALSKLPKMFDIPVQKGYYPHRFNTVHNYSYIGPMPDPEMYDYDAMNASDRTTFLKWYKAEKAKGIIFDNKFELKKYCRLDVYILRMACTKFMQSFFLNNKVEVFFEGTTIASACSKVFRRNFLQNDVIPIMPRGGYAGSDNQSLIAVQWLTWIEKEHNIIIQHAGRTKEKRLKENLLVDGFHEPSNTVFEFFGCYYHGHEKCYPYVQTSKYRGEQLFKRREQTEAKCKRIQDAGYNLISIYECEFKKEISENPRLKQFIDEYPLNNVSRLNLRDAFYGGRTNAVKTYYKIKEGEKIMYFDYCSLYPHVNKNSPYIYDHPKIYVGDECDNVDLNTFHGIIKCTVLPPNQLYLPVLPAHVNGKLVFALCRQCAISQQNEGCQHSNADREITGTWGASEFRLAISKSYRVTKIYEIYEYKVTRYDSATKSGGLFAEYVNNFLKLKVEASGFPEWCKSDEMKDKYIQEFYDREGVVLDKENIKKNPGLRSLAKLMLNSFWGKFGQREDKSTTSIISVPNDLYEKLIDPSIEVNSIIGVNDEVIIVNSTSQMDKSQPLKTVSLPVAIYTTMGARLLLYKVLDMLTDRVLYFDTDSIIFVTKPGDEIPPTGDFLGDLTDEVLEYGEGSYISEFISGGPKNYAYKVYSPSKQEEKTVCKVKGFSLNFKNSQKINFNTVKEMILSGDDNQELFTEDYRICRTKENVVYSKMQVKKYRAVYTKRRRLNDGSFDTLPFGYKNDEDDDDDELSKLIRLFPGVYE